MQPVHVGKCYLSLDTGCGGTRYKRNYCILRLQRHSYVLISPQLDSGFTLSLVFLVVIWTPTINPRVYPTILVAFTYSAPETVLFQDISGPNIGKKPSWQRGESPEKISLVYPARTNSLGLH